MKVINIIAPNIKSGGGKELLEYLLEYIDDNYPDIAVNVYVDTSVNIQRTRVRNVIVMTSEFNKVILFFKRFENAIYFGNLPPIRKSKNSIIGVIGLGYVGLPLIIRFSEQGFKTIGFDIDAEKVEKLCWSNCCCCVCD